jgi:hypothetical protein
MGVYKDIGVRIWIHLAQDKIHWWTPVNMVMNFGFYKRQLDQLTDQVLKDPTPCSYDNSVHRNSSSCIPNN